MSDFRKQWNDTCKTTGIASIGKDTAAKLLAIIYVLGGEREVFTHNEKLKADLEYVQETYSFFGGLIPDVEVKNKFRNYVKELEANEKEPPKWAGKLMEENYNIKL